MASRGARADLIKAATLKARLRAKFIQRDRLERQIVVLDEDIAGLIRTLALFERVPYIRVEAARAMVFGEPVTEEAAE